MNHIFNETSPHSPPQEADELYQQSLPLISGGSLSLSTLSLRALLIVNTASRCGFTPQYQQLEELHQLYHSRGLSVIGCPCGQFGGQELGSNDDIARFCQRTFEVSFTLTEKLKVNGADAHPLFTLLKQRAPGLMNTQAIKWNFTKFLIAPKATMIKRYSPQTSPQSLTKEIEQILHSVD